MLACMKKKFRLYSLPGFLGHPSDWEGILTEGEHWRHEPCHYYDSRYAAPYAGLRAWADSFNRTIAPESNNILMGYSLGGRLALHALLRKPTLWQGAVIISAHPGLSPEERPIRQERDEAWAEKFEKTPIEESLAEWNGQPLFKENPLPGSRDPKLYDRLLLANTLRHWSLGKQQDLMPEVSQLSCPVLWILGAEDDRYMSLRGKLTLKHACSRVLVLENAGHRAPWQQPAAFRLAVEAFIQEIQQNCLVHV